MNNPPHPFPVDDSGVPPGSELAQIPKERIHTNDTARATLDESRIRYPMTVRATPAVRTATLVRTTDPRQLDAICASAYDWLMLDGEHPGVGLAEMATMLREIGGRHPCYARVRSLDPEPVRHALAHGAYGVIVPNVDTAMQAEESVRLVRTSQWPSARVVVQAESTAAVRNIEAIVAVPGIEWVLIGPYDLTRSLGIPEQFDAPAYEAAVGVIEAACARAGVPVGIFGMTPERVAPHAARGHRWAVVGIDRVT